MNFEITLTGKPMIRVVLSLLVSCTILPGIATAQLGVESINSDPSYRIINFRFWPSVRDRLDMVVERDNFAVNKLAGYRAIRFRLKYRSGKPQPTDQKFKLVMYDRRQDISQTVVRTVTIPAGATFVDGQMSLRSGANEAKYCQWALYEENNPGLSFDNLPISSIQQTGVNSHRPTLLIDTSVPDFDTRYQNVDSKSFPQDTALVSLKSFFQNLEMRHPNEFPTIWRDLTAYEQIVLSYKTLDNWHANQPQKCETLRNWIAAGGRLVLYGDDIKENIARWTENAFCNALGEIEMLARLKSYPVGFPAFLDSRRVFGMGSVYPVEAIKLFDSKTRTTSNLQSRLRFTINRVANTNADSKLDIPGIGEPPVNTFRVLITLFFAVVGPLNYFLLRYFKRLHLILFTLPAFALLACVSLIAYSLVADGIKTRGRVISFSRIDQESGQLASFSQQAYYSPFQGSSSVSSGDDTAIFPVLFEQVSSPFVTINTDNGQTISGGNMKTRTMNQFAVVRSAPCDARIEIIESGSSLKFRNRLKGDLRCVVFHNQGRFYYAGKTLAGEENHALEIAVGEIPGKVQGFLDAAIIVGTDETRLQRLGINRGKMLSEDYTPNSPSTIAKAFSAHRNLDPDTYYAIVESSAEIPLLRPNANFESSLNVILGSW